MGTAAVLTGTRRSLRPPGRGSTVLGFVVGVVIMLVVGTMLWFALGWPRLLGGGISAGLSLIERRGEVLYNANCSTCHGGPTGGTMMDYPPRHNANGHTWHHPDCELTQIIREGGDEMTQAMREMMAPPNAPTMQPFKDRLSTDEITAVLAFIKTMWTPDEREEQALITQEQCTTARSAPRTP